MQIGTVCRLSSGAAGRISGKEQRFAEESMELKYYSLSADGGRDHNEDSVGVADAPQFKCFILADGLGGHGRGEVASSLAVETVRSMAEKFSGNDLGEWLADAFTAAQQNVIAEQESENFRSGMKTTLTVLAVSEKTVQWGHIGDSRLYHFRRGKVSRRTLGHSVPQMLVSAGQIKEKEIRHHPDRNRLLRVIGAEWETPKYEIAKAVNASRGDAYLLCSDGFWELIEEKQMEKLLKAADSPEQWLCSMRDVVLANGAKQEAQMDNYSAIGVWLC